MTSFFEKLKKGMEINPSASPRINGERPSTSLGTSPEFIEGRSRTIKNLPEKESAKEPSLAIYRVQEKKIKNEIKKRKRVEKKEEGLKKIKVKEEPAVTPSGGVLNETTAGKKAGGKEEKRGTWLQPEGQLTVDVYQTDKEIVIQSAIAGIRPEDLDISIENGMIIIRGNREKPSEKDERNYFYQECYWGPFSREIVIPDETDNSKIEASIKQGVLTIRMPKIEREKVKKIIIKE